VPGDYRLSDTADGKHRKPLPAGENGHFEDGAGAMAEQQPTGRGKVDEPPVCRDEIDRLHRQLAERSTQDALARIILDEMYQFVAILDPSGRTLGINRSALDAVGTPDTSLIGRPFWETPWWTVSPDLQTTLQALIRRAAAGEFVRVELQHYGAGGQHDLIDVDFSLKPVLNPAGQAAYLIAEGRDITDKKRAEAEIARQTAEIRGLYEQLKAFDQLKSQFFANVSHELRTPLTLVLGLSDRLQEDPTLAVAQRRDLAAIERNARLLLKQVNDILDLTKLEAGKMTVNYEAVDLAHLVRLAASPFEVLAAERHLALAVDVPASLPAQLDAEKVEHVLANLLSNAVKFTPQGGHIGCRLQVHGPAAAITVSDSGPGIPADQREAIFERFVQVDGGADRRYGGTGLGLAIAKEFVALHGGTIAVGDAPGGGGLFTVTLPLTAPPGRPVREASPATPAPATPVIRDESASAAVEVLRARVQALSTALPASRPLVLVVEDHAEMNSFIAEILGREYRIATAFDGQEGLDMALALLPDLILTDVMMPRMSGGQLVHAVRKRPELDAVPIVLLTARADDDLRVHLLRQGAQDYLAKPFQKGELLARVGNLITMKQARDILQQELDCQVHDLADLAVEVAHRRRELQTALESVSVARDQAVRASQLRANFLRLVSHEIRTPLTILQLHLQVLGMDDTMPLTPKQQASVQKMALAGKRLLDLVNTILEYARIESGKMPIHAEAIDLTALAEDVCTELRPQAEQRHLTLHLTAAADLPSLESDPKLVRLILVNLVGNAIKFTDRGGVAVALSAAAGRHHLVVHDTGPGIAADKMTTIFEPFEHVEPANHKHTPGLGLGLALVKEMVDALGGSIEVSSHVGEGSAFTVTLPSVYPLPAGAERAMPPMSPSAPQNEPA
jgi:PAS domain S-box-containing protein